MMMIDLNQLDEHISYSNGTLMEAKRVLFEAAEVVIVRKSELAYKEAQETAAGLEGKNAEERKAALSLAVGPERALLDFAEAHERKCRHALEMAQMTFDLLRYRLRIAEIMSKESEK
jgi:hypothetical protein